MNKINTKTIVLRIFLALSFMFLLQASLTAVTASGAESDWDSIVAKAKQEGKLVVSASHTPAVRQATTTAFKAAYGIDIEYMGGGKGSELGRKLLAERQAGMYLQDVYIGGTTTILTALKPAGALDPLEPMLLLPEVRDKKLWIGGDYLWSDRDKKVIVILMSPSAGQSIIVNTTMVNPGEIKVYDDFLNPKWKDKIVMNDPTVQGPGLRFVGAGATKIKSWDFMKELAKQNPAINRNQRLQVEWVARGKYAIGLGMEPNLITEFIKAGALIEEVLPEDDHNASAGPNDLCVINRAAHPNAAKVFVNWVLSREGQTVLSLASGIGSVKTNASTDHLRPVRRLNPAKKYFIIDHEDYILKEKGLTVNAKEIFGSLMK
ncbi:MAG: extracellular solute-binding protein [Desulfobacterales bacterium]|nr:extracellular solute-binding protein [Desulfobacterales bacterium]